MARSRFDRVVLDYKSRRRAADGSLVVRGRFARTGLQSYQNDDGTERIEYRPPEEVRASASTFEGVAVTDLHPAGMVDTTSWSSLARGHVQGVTFADGPDGENWLEGDFHIKAADLVDRIERGERPELSAGYFCDEDEEPGEYQGKTYHCSQRGIVGNHVASIPGGTARAGREARLLLDSTGNQLPPGSRRADEPETKERTMDEFEIVLGGVTYKVKADATSRQALIAYLAHSQGLHAAVDTQRARTDSAETERDSLKAKLDAAQSELAELKAMLADATDQKRIDSAVKARAELIDRARRLGGPEINTDGSDLELKVRALEAFGVKLADDARKSAAYVDARMDAALERLQEMEDEGDVTIHDALAGVHAQPVRNGDDWLRPAFEAHARMMADQNREED